MSSASRQNQYYCRLKERMKHDEEFRKGYNEKRRNRKSTRLKRKLENVGFDINKIDSGLCCYIDCTTVLSKYNNESCCSKHQRIVVKNGFYEVLEKERFVRLESRDL